MRCNHLNRAERNNRLILLITILGVSGYLTNKLEKILVSSFNVLIEGELPISASQVFSSLLISGFFIILVIAIIFILLEMNSFRNLELEEHIIAYSTLADITYKILMTTILRIILYITLITVIVGIFPNILVFFLRFLKENNSIFIYISLILPITILSVTLFPKQVYFVFNKVLNIKYIPTIFDKFNNMVSKIFTHNNTKRKYFREKEDYRLYLFAQRLTLDSKNTQNRIRYFFLFLWLALFFPISVLIGGNSNISTSFHVDYQDEKMILSFNGHTGDFLPKEITIMSTLKNKCVTVPVSIKDFSYSAANISFVTEDKTFNRIHKNTIDLKFELPYNKLGISQKEGTGSVLIFFSYDKFTSLDTLKIINPFNYDKKHLEFHSRNYDINL